jgi:tRNA (guanine-N7-)-methyltransferase
MTPSQRGWLDQYAARWVIPVAAADHLATAVAPQPALDLQQVFGRTAPLVVEVGSGHGDTLAAAATARPDRDFLGFEVFEASLASTLGKVAAAGSTNVRLVAADAVTGLTHLLKDESVTELWVFFPDPWPKTRHHKRRLVTPAFAGLAARKLRPGGLIRLATDWSAYARAMAETFDADDRFDCGGTARFAGRPVTKFEARGLAAGRTIHDLAYVKVAP